MLGAGPEVHCRRAFDINAPKRNSHPMFRKSEALSLQAVQLGTYGTSLQDFGPNGCWRPRLAPAGLDPIPFSALRRSAFRPRFLRHTHSRRNRGRANGAVMLHEAGIFNARPFGFALENRHRNLSLGIETTLQNSNRLASNWFRPTKPQASTPGRYSSVASERVSLSALWAAMLNLSGPAAGVSAAARPAASSASPW